MSVGAARCARARLFTRTWLARLAGKSGERPGEADGNELVFKILSKNRQGTPSNVRITWRMREILFRSRYLIKYFLALTEIYITSVTIVCRSGIWHTECHYTFMLHAAHAKPDCEAPFSSIVAWITMDTDNAKSVDPKPSSRKKKDKR